MNRNIMKQKKLPRRNFLKQTGIVSAGLLTFRLPFINDNNFIALAKGIPSILKKNIDPEWIKSLHNRGTVTTCLKSKNELQYIGMPVGGINCGTVYLGGDGRLWLWDIFNKNQEGIEPKVVDMDEIEWKSDWRKTGKVRSRDGACYVQPSKDIRPLEQGFAIKLTFKGSTIVKRFHPVVHRAASQCAL